MLSLIVVFFIVVSIFFRREGQNLSIASKELINICCHNITNIFYEIVFFSFSYLTTLFCFSTVINHILYSIMFILRFFNIYKNSIENSNHNLIFCNFFKTWTCKAKFIAYIINNIRFFQGI